MYQRFAAAEGGEPCVRMCTCPPGTIWSISGLQLANTL